MRFKLLLPLLLLAACTDHIGKTYDEAGRDLTGAALRSRLAAKERVRADAFPLGATIQGRRCGGPLGTTDVAGLPGREPLMSSIAWATDGLVGKPFQPGETYERQLRAASIRHDYCYGHGAATYGRTWKDCDLWLRADALRLCKSVEGSTTRAGCDFRSELPFLAVAPLGWTFYNDNLQPTCEYDPGPNPPRDFVLSGRFLNAPGVLPGQVLHISPEGRALRLRIAGFRDTGAPGSVRLLDALLPFDDIIIAAELGAPQGEQCARSPCSLGAIRLLPQDFLALAPKVADLDGDGLDDVAFVAIEGLRDRARPGYGMLAMAVSPAASLAPDRLDIPRIAAGFVRTRDERAGAAPDGTLSPSALRQQIDVLGQTWLTGRFLKEEGRRAKAEQLLLVALRVERDGGEFRLAGAEERGFAEFRVLYFPSDLSGRFRIGPPRMLRSLFRNDAVYFTAADERGRLTELYRRFQNPPLQWEGVDGRSGVLLLARDWLDTPDAAHFPIPPGVLKPQLQDRGMRVIAYGPPAPSSDALVPERNLKTTDGLKRSTGCDDLAAGDPDWLGCHRPEGAPPTVMARFVWNWTREVNPVLALPDGSNRHAAVALAAAVGDDLKPLSPRREALVFFLTPSLHPEALRRNGPDDHQFVHRVAVLPAPGAKADGKAATEAGSWLNYPALSARLGPAGEGGIALFRTVPVGNGAALEIAAAIPDIGGQAWRITRASCPLPLVLTAANIKDARAGIEGGTMAHLRLSPMLRVAGKGPRDGFVVATRERGPGGEVKSDSVILTSIQALGTEGWIVDGTPCEMQSFK